MNKLKKGRFKIMDWKKINGYQYLVSEDGQIKNIVTGKILRQVTNKQGYKIVCLSKDGQHKTFKVHRLVAQAFLPNDENKPCVDHIDGDKTNNHYKNLRWASYYENNHNPVTRERYRQTIEYKRSLKPVSEPFRPKQIKVSKDGVEFIFENTKELLKQSESVLGVTMVQSVVSRVCNGKIKTYKGYKMQYA